MRLKIAVSVVRSRPWAPLLPRLLLISFLAGVGTAASRASDAVVRGLDHVPIAVGNLEKARTDYEALGFVIKPGRPHANGIENVHVKFPDGTEVELITATRGSDTLSSDYLNWLKDGDGPAFLGLFAPNLDSLAMMLWPHGLSLSYRDGVFLIKEQAALRVFFSRRQHSPTDRPEHFAHPNTAFSLSGVWLAGGEAESGIVRMLGGVPSTAGACGHLGPAKEVQAVPEAKFYLLPANAQLVPGRTIVGLTISVRDLEAARRVLDKSRIQYFSSENCREPGLWIAPVAAHGVWLELRQQS
jgi:Glyoxalase-like domain